VGRKPTGRFSPGRRFRFFNKDVIAQLEQIGLAGKTIAQFCCNNGRELLCAMQLSPACGVGFDIAENFIGQARQTATKLGRTNCEFVACNLLDIDEAYYNRFDFVFFTVGAITWFKDLRPLFDKTAKCLKPQGKLLINDYHPFTNMLPMSGEDAYDPAHLNRVTYSYFKEEPWIENSGMSYITPDVPFKNLHELCAYVVRYPQRGDWRGNFRKKVQRVRLRYRADGCV